MLYALAAVVGVGWIGHSWLSDTPAAIALVDAAVLSGGGPAEGDLAAIHALLGVEIR